MINEDEIRKMLADRGGNVTTTDGAQGAVKIRIRAERSLLRTILDLDDQGLCIECQTVQDEDEDWPMQTMCPDCATEYQTKLDDIEIEKEVEV